MWTVLVALLCLAGWAAALDNGLARTPPMGFANWNGFGCNYNSSTMRAQADGLYSGGFLQAGYDIIIIQECIAKTRDANGRIVPDPEKFPEGMPALVDYIHSRDIKAGIYTDVGPQTCANYVGSYEHEEIDAQTFADWGIDFVEEDSCHHPAYPNGTLIPYEILYGRMRDALNATGRPIIFYSCVQGQENVSLAWGTQMANLWRTTGDICAPMHATWSGVINNFRGNAKYPQISGPGHWQDPDMLVVGMDGLSALEWRTHFSLWAMSAAPLWIGIDVPSMGAEARAILLNTDVIAVDQDPLGHAATQRNATTTVMDRQPGVADNTAVTLQACATAPSWVYTRANGSLSTLNVCATIESCSVAAGGSVIFYDCVGQQGGCPANQGFALVPGPGSGALLIRANISGMCLTSHGAGQAVDQQPCDTTSANQLWQFQGDGRITWAPSSAQLCLGVATQPGEVWARPLQQSPNGSFRGAALFFNPDDSQNVTITASRSALGVPSAAKVVAVTDLWSKQTFELGPSLTSRLLAPHDSMMVVLQELA